MTDDTPDQAQAQTGSPQPPTAPCRHDSTRHNGTLDDHCLRCGFGGYWHLGHRHDEGHPSGKVLFRLDCAGEAKETLREGTVTYSGESGRLAHDDEPVPEWDRPTGDAADLLAGDQ